MSYKFVILYKLNVMDAKITLSFNEIVIQKAKRYAAKNNISLSRLVEFMLQKTVSGHYPNLDDLPISDWVAIVAEGEADYRIKKKSRKSLKNEFFSSKK